MAFLKKSLKYLLLSLLICFLAFFVYANWEKPDAGTRIYMENPTGVVMYDIPSGFSADSKTDLGKALASRKDIVSHTFSDDGQNLIVTYQEKTADQRSLTALVHQYNVTEVTVAASNKPQCPADPYIGAWNKLKYTLCLRK